MHQTSPIAGEVFLSMKTFAQAEQFLLSLSNFPRREYMKDPKKCDIYLKRVQAFLDILGNPEKKVPHYIHVAGTSGKGSVTNFLHSILHADGRIVGSTTSPHATMITERWRVGTKHMSKKDFVEIVTELKPALDTYMKKSTYDVPSFYEFTTIIAFMYFARKKMEWAIIEVGCGGRFDSANILKKKDIAVITNIGLDHQELLGDTKEKIAWEKAGIITKGCRAVFTAEKDKKLRRIFRAEATKNGVHELTTSNTSISEPERAGVTYSFFSAPQSHSIDFTLQAAGKHQIDNAFLCVEIARHLGIDNKTIARGLKKTKQPLRMETIAHDPLTILDGAHNPDKMKSSVDTLKDIVPRDPKNRPRQFHLVVGFSANKDIAGMFKELKRLNIKTVACTRNTINHFRKAADPRDIAALCKKYLPGAVVRVFVDPMESVSWIKKRARTRDIIFITGSLYLSGQLRPLLKK